MAMFADVNSDVILYGHDHTRNICRGDKLYINVGETIDVEYDAAEVVRRINELNYPDAENIKKYFYGI